MLSAEAGAASAAGIGAARPAGAAGSAGAVILITGDRAVLAGAPGGPRVAAMVPASHVAGAGAYQVIGRGDTALVVPAVALPYLGRGLDPSLFNVAALQQAERNGRLPVRVAYRGQRPALPGVQLTSSAAGIASGYLTLAAAKRFGAELLRLNRADRSAGRYGTDGLFANGLTIGLAGQPGSVSARPPGRPGPVVLRGGPDHPAFKMKTLTIHANNRFGKPDTGDMVEVGNADNFNFFDETTFFDNGVAKVSVPVGHYWAIGQFFDFFDLHNAVPDWRFTVAPQFTVRKDSTVKVNETSSVSEIIMHTPRRAVPLSTFFDLLRTGGSGPAADDSFEGVGLRLWVNTTKVRPTVGKLSEFLDQQLVSPAKTRGTAYEYDIAKAILTGLIPPQHFTVRPASLATVNARYIQDVTSSGSLFRVGTFPQQEHELIGALLNPFTMPHHQIEYMTGDPSVQWLSGTGQIYGFSFGGELDAGRTFHAGEVTDENWNAYPLSPQPEVNLAGTANFSNVQPSADRSGNTLILDVSPYGDSQPGHDGPDFAGGSYRISENDKQIAHRRLGRNFLDSGVTAQARLSGRPSVVKVALNVSRPLKSYPLSPTVHAVWTWRSARQPHAVLPKGWTCRLSGFIGVPDAGRHCAVQPMIMLHYVVAKLGLNGRTGPGRQQIAISASQLPLARVSAITSLAVQVSFDGGKTWRPARLSRTGNASYRATFNASAGSYVTLRARATDAAGGSVTEILKRAYQVGGGGIRVAGHVMAIGKPLQRMRPACPGAAPRQARCFAFYAPEVAVNRAQAAGAAAKPRGWGANSVESAYKLPVDRKVTQTVAVVDAFATPNLARSLNTYRKQYGLPPCFASSGCLRLVNQKGKASPLPPSGVPAGWDVETALDVEMVSAACPSCHILVVEANDPEVNNLAAAAKTAARLGAQVISNSYGLAENGFVQPFGSAYHQSGHTTVVASGDFGFGPADFPANLPGVVSVGGTELSKSHTARGWTEQVWNTDGLGATASGCSAYIAKPSWQHDGHCSMRTLNDVSALAEGLAVYDKARGGWLRVDGTSAAAPIIAGVYGLAANGATSSVAGLYAHASGLFDVTKGDDVFRFGGVPVGSVCGGDYLCKARAGYDGPTGLGTPDGITSF
ncbi:MAG TPA: S8 family serine peptidase [Streptosporangiaceae bacterium]|nr:S8 family serine peptidase [Streptosporangiaceae bacterium]